MAASPYQTDRMPEEELGERLDEPRRFKVILHNDDYSTMDFVVLVLVSIFHKSQTEATRIMLEVHIKGTGVAGIWPREDAETRVERVHELAQARGYPLRCTMEPE